MSFGGPGEGARLILGTDITDVKAKMVNVPNGPIDQQGLVERILPTLYMVAAGAPGEDNII